MPRTTIDRLIINSPYEEPRYHWRYDPASKLFDLAEGRRPAGYVVATPGSKAFDDPGLFVGIPRSLGEWVQAVNAHGGFGRWKWAVVQRPGEIKDVLMSVSEPLGG